MLNLLNFFFILIANCCYIKSTNARSLRVSFGATTKRTAGLNYKVETGVSFSEERVMRSVISSVDCFLVSCVSCLLLDLYAGNH